MPKYRFEIHVTSNNFSLLVNMCFHIYVIKIHFCCKFYYSNHTRFDFNVSICIPFSFLKLFFLWKAHTRVVKKINNQSTEEDKYINVKIENDFLEMSRMSHKANSMFIIFVTHNLWLFIFNIFFGIYFPFKKHNKWTEKLIKIQEFCNKYKWIVRCGEFLKLYFAIIMIKNS